MPQKSLEFLADRHPYDQISQKGLDELGANIERKKFGTGEAIYEIGTQALGLYVVFKGEVEVRGPEGEIISVLGRGNTFGERGLLSNEGLCVTGAVALSDATVVFIPAENFQNLMKDEHVFARFFSRGGQNRRPEMNGQDLAIAPVSQIMSQPVLSVDKNVDISEAAQRMRKARVSCLAVTEKGALVGVFTLRDLVYKVLADKAPPKVVGEIMSSPPFTLTSKSLVIDAMMMMARHHIGHLLVVDDGELKGILTKSNLVTRGANSLMAVLLEISKADSAEAMKKPVSQLPELLAQMAGAGVDGHIVTRLLTDIADAVTKRLIAIYEKDHGRAPGPYVWGACGSQGRREQTGVSDQDNCIIYADEVSDPSWFEGLARFVSDGMDAVGYMYCPGDMMATNPRWCANVSTWRGYFEGWIARPTEEAQMLASVMFDLRAIEGDASILVDIQENVLARASENSIFLAFLISNSLKHQPPLSLFRGVSTIRDGEHKNTIDLKHSGIVPITDLARVYAIKAEVKDVNTRSRLGLAMDIAVLSGGGGGDLIAAYDFLQDIRLRHQAHQIRAGKSPDNYLNPSTLSDLERSHLRDAFVVVKSMQSALSRQSAP